MRPRCIIGVVRAFTSILIVGLLVVSAAGCRTAANGSAPGAPSDSPGSTAAAPNAGAGNRAASSAAPPIVQPGAPGEPTRQISAARATDLSAVRHTAADVTFMQGMIHHHAQALDMTALVADRTAREDMKLLALRIELSQQDEIGMMQGWLEAVGEPAPTAHDHHEPGMPLMPGMLTAEQMAQLADARGEAFDRLFLEGMVRHHEGALLKVDELYATPGAGQESNVSTFAAEVVADQRAEIDRMNAMLNAMIKEPLQ